MSPDLAVVLALLAAAAAMFVIVGLSMSAALPLTKGWMGSEVMMSNFSCVVRMK